MSQAPLSRRSFPTPFGFITVTAEAEKITTVELCKKVSSIGASKVIDQAEEQLKLYLEGSLAKFTLPLKVSGTPFQLAVWRAISKVPFGKTISYGQIAAQIGKPPTSNHSCNQHPETKSFNS
jgi:methylated-DNA-[protein]-cysteine S-methyltransferase